MQRPSSMPGPNDKWYMELEGQMAKSLNVPVHLLNLYQQIQMMAKSAGPGDEDPKAVVKIYEQITGVPLAKAPDREPLNEVPIS